MYGGMTEKDFENILQEKPTKLYYKFNEFDYIKENKKRILSGIKQLDYLIKGFELGCITIWTGLTNNGKTTMLTMIAKETIKQREKVFFFNGEQTKDDFKNNIYKQSVKSEKIYFKQYKDTNILDFFVKDDELIKLDKVYGENLIVYNNDINRDIDTLLLAMYEVHTKEKVNVFILDNFMQIDMKSDNVYQEQTSVMEKLRTFAVNENVHIHLVAHPRKVERFTTRLSLYDISGSGNLSNKAYNIINIMRVDNINKENNEYKKICEDMFRERYDIRETSTILEVLKTKGNKCGLVGLTYDETRKTFIEQKQVLGDNLHLLKSELEIDNKTNKKNKCPF